MNEVTLRMDTGQYIGPRLSYSKVKIDHFASKVQEFSRKFPYINGINNFAIIQPVASQIAVPVIDDARMQHGTFNKNKLVCKLKWFI
jgi:hypothetical protein